MIKYKNVADFLTDETKKAYWESITPEVSETEARLESVRIAQALVCDMNVDTVLAAAKKIYSFIMNFTEEKAENEV